MFFIFSCIYQDQIFFLLQPHSLLSQVKSTLSEEEQRKLFTITEAEKFVPTLLPIRTVGVQGDHRTYSYCAALSNDKEQIDWEHLKLFASVITKVCRNVNRVVYMFGSAMKDPVHDVTPTFLTPGVLNLLRECDHKANTVLREEGCSGNISQMPVILLPLHFDRDPNQQMPSCQHSVVIRTLITADFMTGVPAWPPRDMPVHVLHKMVTEISKVEGISRIMYDLTSKPPGTTEWE